MSEGWICLHRKMLEWEWYDDANATRLFIHCLLKANHGDKKWRGIEVKRGSFITSYDSLSKELGLTVKQIRTALTKLKRTSEVASKSNSQHTVLTVINYDQYQDEGKQKGGQGASEGQAGGKQGATTNNENNDNNGTKDKVPNGTSSTNADKPKCPHQEIIKIYHEVLPACQKVVDWNKTRSALLRARWNEDPKRQNLEWWRKYLTYVGESKFLTGRVEPKSDALPFMVDLEWVIRPTNFSKIIEGKYHRQ